MIERTIISDIQILDFAVKAGDITRKDLMHYQYGYSKSAACQRLRKLVKDNFLEKLANGVHHVIYLITESGYKHWQDNKKYLD